MGSATAGMKGGDRRKRLLRALSPVLLFGALAAPTAMGIGAERQATADDDPALQGMAIGSLAKLTLEDNARVVVRGKSAAERNAQIPLDTAPLENMGAFRSIAQGNANHDKAVRCLAQAVYYEAANEPLEGQRAVAQVVLNRVQHPAYPSSVCGVVYEGWNQPVCQFSFVCDGSLLRAPMASKWNRAQDIARSALAGHVERRVGSATHYHADYVVPRWAFTLDKVQQVGTHLFYRFPGRGGRSSSFTARWGGREAIPQIDFARFNGMRNEEQADVIETASAIPLRDITDRRADNDVGGRMDPSKQWRLTIPDPVNASASYNASRQAQAGPRVASGDDVATLAGGDPS